MDVLKSKDNLTLFSLPKVHVIFSGECAIYTMVNAQPLPERHLTRVPALLAIFRP